MTSNISIIIPTYNRLSYLRCAIESIKDQTIPGVEIIVVDNGPSNDGTSDFIENLVQKNGHIKYIKTTAVGCIISRNMGLEKATGNILLTMDDDVKLINRESLSWVAVAFKEDNQLGILGSIEIRSAEEKLVITDIIDTNIGRVYPHGYIDSRFTLLYKQGIARVDHCRSAFLACRREAFKAVGGFNTRYKALGLGYRYETAFCLEVKKAGYSVAVHGDIVILHEGAPRQRGFKRGRGILFHIYSHRNQIYFLCDQFGGSLLRNILSLIRDTVIGTPSVPGLLFLIKHTIKSKNVFYPFLFPLMLIGKIWGLMKYYRAN